MWYHVIMTYVITQKLFIYIVAAVKSVVCLKPAYTMRPFYILMAYRAKLYTCIDIDTKENNNIALKYYCFPVIFHLTC